MARKKKKKGKHKSPGQISDSGNKCLFYYNVKLYFFFFFAITHYTCNPRSIKLNPNIINFAFVIYNI